MEADSRFIERAAFLQVDHVEHDMAAPDDVEGRIEDVCRNGHVVFPALDSLTLMARRRARAVSNHEAMY
jgi:hypothetical protein